MDVNFCYGITPMEGGLSLHKVAEFGAHRFTAAGKRTLGRHVLRLIRALPGL
jgi:hypothetical protein